MCTTTCTMLVPPPHGTAPHLWFLVYLWVHLRAEEGEKDHFIPSPQEVILSVGHSQYLILNHLSADHHGGGESEGLTQDAICRIKWTAVCLMSA